MRQALRIATLLLLAPLLAAPVRAASCAVRLRGQASSAAPKGAALQSILAALPEPPRQARPLLAGALGSPALHPFSVWQVLHFSDRGARDRSLELLRAHPAVEFVEVVRTLHLAQVPEAQPSANTSRSGRHLAAEISWNVERVGAPAAWREIEPDSTLIVAVIDTGADLAHPDLQPRLWRNDDPPGNARSDDDANDQNADGFIEEWEREDDDDNGYVDDAHGFDFTDAPDQGGVGDALERDPDPSDESGHGTHVAGIIAADGRLRGVAPFVRLMPVRAAFGTIFGAGSLETDDAAAAIIYAVDNGARVLNLSWGDTQESRLVREALEYALERDVIVVAAAGNGASDAPHWPSGDPRVIAVAASNRSGARAAFSNFGSGVEIAAPGEEFPFPGAGIRSLEPTAIVPEGIGERRGTSMAAPHVAGVAAILLSRSERPDARRVRALLLAGARRSRDADWSADLGHGEVDALASVRSDDDLIVTVLGPPHPYRRGSFTLIGTILGGDAPLRSLSARHRTTGRAMDLFHALAGQVVADTLAHVELGDVPEGEWEYRLTVDSGDGGRREHPGTFVVDRTPAAVDTLAVTSGWRAGAPRWLLSARTDEPVSIQVRARGVGTTLLADAGFSNLLQLEVEARPNGASEWDVDLENVAGLQTSLQVAQPGVLTAWPEQTGLVALDSRAGLLLDPVHGVGPSGGQVAWGRSQGALGPMQAWGVQNDRLQLQYDTGRQGRPVAYEDANGDGASDLLFQRFDGRVVWLMTRAAATHPDSIGFDVEASRALGFFQLDDDAAVEAILSTDDLLFIHDDAVAGAPARIATLSNPNRSGFNVWGADAVAGDVDSDGRIEIVCGDAEGFVTLFERSGSGFVVERTLDTGGVYAYDLSALLNGGFLVGRQRSVDVAGDGFPTAAYDFLEMQDGLERARYTFLAPENDLRFGSSGAHSAASGAFWLALAQGEDLHLLRGDRPRQRVTRIPTADGTPPVLADLDADGRLEILVRSAEGARLYRVVEAGRGPHALRSESLGAGALQLTWVPGDSGVSRLRRSREGESVVLGETSAATWIDTTLVAFTEYAYEVEQVVAGVVRARTRRVKAQAQPRPRLRCVDDIGAASLRLHFTNAIHPKALEPRRFAVWGADASPRRVLQVVRAEAGRAIDLLLDEPLGCGDRRVVVDSLRDDQWGLLDPPRSEQRLEAVCAPQPFHVVTVQLSAAGDALVVEFNREPDAAALDVGLYRLSWNGEAQPLVGAERLDPLRVRLRPAPEVQFLARGIPYVLRIDASLVAAGDRAGLQEPQSAYRVYVEGSGTPQLFPYPNPAKSHDDRVVFAEAAPDTRVRIYNLEGELVRELDGARGGGLIWDLRARDGTRVGSGVYLYVARDARGTSRGRIAVAR
ncbi:MAG: S8 family serine peptidase [Candidatus Latescibacterota bacterium]|nr:MAG: S8 family serine peptidase [Candidatus Latescibacterota bacterium]